MRAAGVVGCVEVGGDLLQDLGREGSKVVFIGPLRGDGCHFERMSIGASIED